MTKVATLYNGTRQDFPCREASHPLSLYARNLRCLERMIDYCAQEAVALDIDRVAYALSMAQVEMRDVWADTKDRY